MTLYAVDGPLTMKIANLNLWIIGFCLQAALLVALLRHKLAFRIPIFTSLIAFYIVRAGALFILSSHVTRKDYGMLYEALSVVDLVFQILVAAEIFACLARQPCKPAARGTMTRIAMIPVGIALAGAVAFMTPEVGLFRTDRGVVFVTVLMLLLLIWTFRTGAGIPRQMATGFVVYGCSVLVAGVARNYAVAHRSRAMLAGSSYAASGIYICIVIYWLVALRVRDNTRPGLWLS